jgi:D-3-phosphoglycerate dehydrogenase
VSDFPIYELHGHPKVIFLPHMGASTKEAEENCAVMIAKQIKEFFETGAISDSVNFPSAQPALLMSATRLIIINENIPNMVAQITKKLGDHRLNITYFLNQSRDQIAYNIIDVDQVVSDELLESIGNIEGIIQVRRIQ